MLPGYSSRTAISGGKPAQSMTGGFRGSYLLCGSAVGYFAGEVKGWLIVVKY